MSSANINGLTIEYEVDGAGAPLVCVAGLGMQLTGWPTEWVDKWVARGRQVIRIDNRDVGLSGKTAGPMPTVRQLVLATLMPKRAHSPYTVAEMSDDVAGVLTHLGIERADVVGVSMGGMISQSLAIRHPQRVRSLTSIMSNTGDRHNGKPDRKLLRQVSKAFSRDGKPTVEDGLKMFRLISSPSFDEAEMREQIRIGIERSPDQLGTRRQLMAIAASADRTAALGKVTAPTLVIHGLLDKLVLPSGGIATAKSVPGSRLLMFPDMAHDLPRHRLDEVIDAIDLNAARAG